MKQKIEITEVRVIEANLVSFRVPVYEEDYDDAFKRFVKDEILSLMIDIDTGTVLDWEFGTEGELYTKACDSGVYYLIKNKAERVAEIECDYVPNRLIPGEYGDYIDLKVDKTGKITNWLQYPSMEEFFNREN